MCRCLGSTFAAVTRLRQNHVWLWPPLRSFLARSSCMTSTISSSSNKDRILDSPLARNLEVPDISLLKYVWRDVTKYSSLPAVTCGRTNRSYTYGMAKSASRRFANALATVCSLRAGDVVGILLPNIPEYLIAALGALEAGLHVTFANPLCTQGEIQRQFTDTGAVCIITTPEMLPLLDLGQKLTAHLITIVIGSYAHQKNGSLLSFQKLIDDSLPATFTELMSNNVAVLPYSRGTTGSPKCVKLTHYNLVANLVQNNHPDLTYYEPTTEKYQAKVFSVLQFCHINGFNAVLNNSIANGVHLISLPGFNLDDYINVLTKYKPEVLILEPSMLQILTSHPLVQHHHLETVINVVCLTASAPKNVIENFIKKANRKNINFQQGYGITESSPMILSTPKYVGTNKYGSCGQLLPLTHAKVVDVTTRESLAPHQAGELLVQGPQLMKGYLDEEARKAVIDSQGWLHTGDIAYYDEDGYFYIVDRVRRNHES